MFCAAEQVPPLSTTKPHLKMETCRLCERKFKDWQRYCSSCRARVIAERRAELKQRTNQLADLRAQNKILSQYVDEHARSTHDGIEETEQYRSILGDIAEVDRLEAELQRRNAERARLRERLDECERRAQNAVARLEEVSKELSGAEDVDVGTMDELERQRWMRDLLAARLGRTRRDLLRCLLSFFPLNPASEWSHVIVNMEMPNDTRQLLEVADAEGVGTGLGYIVRLLQIAAPYLDTYMPHRMHFLGSRSTIIDDEEHNTLPLYCVDGVSPSEFERAVRRLNENVWWFCTAQRWTPSSSHGSGAGAAIASNRSSVRLASAPLSSLVPDITASADDDEEASVYAEHVHRTLPNILSVFRMPTLGNALPPPVHADAADGSSEVPSPPVPLALTQSRRRDEAAADTLDTQAHRRLLQDTAPLELSSRVELSESVRSVSTERSGGETEGGVVVDDDFVLVQSQVPKPSDDDAILETWEKNVM